MTLSIAPVTPATVPDMVAVIAGVTGQRLDVGRWQRKYGPGGPIGPGKGRILYDGARPVGCIGAIGFRVDAGDRMLTGWQLCDIFIDRTMRNGRATPMLYEGLMEEIARDGGDLTFGFCNPMSAALLKRRLGHGEIARIDPFDLPVTGGAGWAGRVRRRLWAPLRLTALSAAGLPVDMVEAGPDHWRIRHDPPYLKSRRAMGARVINLNGHRLLLSAGSVLKVGGMGFTPDADLPSLMDRLCQLARDVGATSVRFMVDRRDPLHARLSTLLGQPPDGWYLTAAPLRPGLTLPPQGLRVCFADYENF